MTSRLKSSFLRLLSRQTLEKSLRQRLSWVAILTNLLVLLSSLARVSPLLKDRRCREVFDSGHRPLHLPFSVVSCTAYVCARLSPKYDCYLFPGVFHNPSERMDQDGTERASAYAVSSIDPCVVFRWGACWFHRMEIVLRLWFSRREHCFELWASMSLFFWMGDSSHLSLTHVNCH